ncbi:MAG: tRNA-(ms[2]io[6]A)-hydroxylase [Pseudomonadota bacterium]
MVATAHDAMAAENAVPAPIRDFLRVPTDPQWVTDAAAHLSTILLDHANCELKAASTALSLMHRYPLRSTLVQRMSRLAREELRHFEQVSRVIKEREVGGRTLSASGYAAGLMVDVEKREPGKLVDTLIVGAIIEARSCERFALIAPCLDDSLAKFYRGLLASEARHFEHYLRLAREAAEGTTLAFDTRLDVWLEREAALINLPTTQIRFHSGPLSV